jgi:hypothetical protein
MECCPLEPLLSACERYCTSPNRCLLSVSHVYAPCGSHHIAPLSSGSEAALCHTSSTSLENQALLCPVDVLDAPESVLASVSSSTRTAASSRRWNVLDSSSAWARATAAREGSLGSALPEPFSSPTHVSLCNVMRKICKERPKCACAPQI